MANQHDLDISNATHASVRADLNAALVALGKKQNGATEPPFLGAYSEWADTSANVLKRRNAAGSGWIARDTLNETFVITRSSNTALNAADRSRVISAVAGYTQTFVAAATLGDGWYCFFRNDSADAVILDPNGAETIDGAATLTLDPGYGVLIFCNGTGFVVATALVSVGKARRLRTLQDYYVAGDGTNFSPAFNRWAAGGGRHLIVSDDVDYNFDSTLVIDRAVGTTIDTLGSRSVTLNLRGSNDLLFDIGNAATVRYQVYIRNAIITKQNVSSAGQAIRMRNVWYWGLENLRAYCDNKFWQFLNAYGVGFGLSRNLHVENTRKEWIYMYGGAAALGAAGSLSVGNVFENIHADGCHSATTTDLTDQGGLLFDDYVAATFLRYPSCYRHKGYAVYFRGSNTGRLSNVLNLVDHINVEATNDQSGTLRVDYHSDGASSGGEGAWGEGNNIPAVRLTQNSVQWRITGKYGMKNGAAIGVLDDGTDNEINVTVAGYNNDAAIGGKGLQIGANAFRHRTKGLKVLYSGAVIDNLSPVTAEHAITDVEYHSINSSTPLAGLATAGTNYHITDVRDMSAARFMTAATLMDIKPGARVVTITNSGTIDEIKAYYVGQRVTLRLSVAGIVLRDVNTTTKNIALKTAGVSLTSATGREAITLEFLGDYWWEESRSV